MWADWTGVPVVAIGAILPVVTGWSYRAGDTSGSGRSDPADCTILARSRGTVHVRSSSGYPVNFFHGQVRNRDGRGIPNNDVGRWLDGGSAATPDGILLRR